MVIILLIILFFSLFFIPIKINIFVSKEDYSIKLYRLVVFSKEGGLLRKIKRKDKIKVKNKEGAKGDIKIEKKKGKLSLKISFIKLYRRLRNNIFKPKLKIFLNLNYSLSDAANTAILYGILSNFNYIFYEILSILFKLRNFNFNINPDFNDNLLLEFTISSIISCNLAQIIYMLFLIIKSREKNEEVNP